MFLSTYLRSRHRFLLVYAVIVFVAAGATLVFWPGEWRGVLVMLAVGLGAAWLVGWLCHQHIHRRLHALRETTDAIGRGDLSRCIQWSPHDDFVKLAQSLDRMAIQLKENVREQDRLRQRLTRSEKLALIGELAATVAHEVNNPLDGLQNSTQIIRRNLDNVEQVQRLLDLMDTGLYRIEMIVRQLLTMSRDEPTNPVPTRVDAILDDAVRFIKPKLDRYGIELVVEVPETPLFAHVDGVQIVQVLINLMINAIDAMANVSSGRKRLQLRCREADEAGKVVIDVNDTGCGIREDDLLRIFEPFYSTKAKGEGTGLGLSVAKRIIHAHHGTIAVDREHDRGTCFRITLPVPAHDISTGTTFAANDRDVI